MIDNCFQRQLNTSAVIATSRVDVLLPFTVFFLSLSLLLKNPRNMLFIWPALTLMSSRRKKKKNIQHPFHFQRTQGVRHPRGRSLGTRTWGGDHLLPASEPGFAAHPCSEGTSSTRPPPTPPPAGLGLGETLETQREGGSVMFWQCICVSTLCTPRPRGTWSRKAE